MNALTRRMGSFFNPERFQGWNKQRSYFEGWYFKVLNADASKAYAFIPGIAMDAQSNRHAFIQVLDGKKKQRLTTAIPLTLSYLRQTGSMLHWGKETHFLQNMSIWMLATSRPPFNFQETFPGPSPFILRASWDLSVSFLSWNVIMGLSAWTITSPVS